MTEKDYPLQDEYLESSKEVIKNLSLHSNNLIKFINRADCLSFYVIAGSFLINPLTFFACSSLSLTGIIKLKDKLNKTNLELNSADNDRYNYLILQRKKEEIDACFGKLIGSNCEGEKFDIALQKVLEQKFRFEEEIENLNYRNNERVKKMIIR